MCALMLSHIRFFPDTYDHAQSAGLSVKSERRRRVVRKADTDDKNA